MKQGIAGALAALMLLAYTPQSQAQDRKIEQSIKHRRAAFTLMSTYFSRLLQTVEGDRPFDANLVRNDAQMVALLSRLPWEGFAPGSERGDTKAKEEIWFEEERFKKLSAELEAKANALAKVAESSDLKKLKVAFEQTRDTCNACHKEFRKK
jgi:cytochrome c556